VGHIHFDDLTERTLPSILRRQAELRPATPYVLADDTCLTYAEVDELADRYAGGLADLGVEQGDTVALFMDSWPEIIPLTFGVNRRRAIWVPTNIDYKGAWLNQTLVDGQARVLVADGALLPRLAEVADGLDLRHVVVHGEPEAELPGAITLHSLDELAAADRRAPEPGDSYGDTAAVLWTSGTTGRSKGVMQSHNAWIRASITGAASARTTDTDVLFCCMPLYNSAGWISTVYRALVAGVPFGLDRRFSVGDFWDRIRHYGATQAFTLGAMHIFLWQAPERPDDADNPLRCLGATPMPEPLLEPFKRRFGIDIIQQGYGQSEVMGLISRIDDGTTAWNAGSCGTPLPGVEVALLDDDDREVPTGSVGEFCVRPAEPYVLFNGYLNRAEETLAAFRNLWYHTGDLGRVDQDGQYYFVDRKGDYIRFKGRSVSSFEVESTFRQHPAVAQAAAVGIESDILASEAELMVVVELKPGHEVSEQEAASFVAENAPHFFVPRFIEVTGQMPYTPTGKVQKYKLRERGVTASTWDREASGFAARRSS
jgi:carnitine-CoA ligase